MSVSPTPTKTPKIEFRDVSKIYNDESTALLDISFSVQENEFVTLTGHSGAGKSTLLKLLLAEIEPTEGEIYIDGTDIETLSRGEIVEYRKEIGTIFQNFRLLSSKTVFENVAFVMEVSGFTDEEIQNDVPYVLQLVNLGEKAFYFPNELSGGEQQRVAIARAIVTRPEILIADEPTGNLDPINTYEVIEILKQIHKLGHTVILTSHDKEVVKKVKGRVITIQDGELIRDSDKGEFSL